MTIERYDDTPHQGRTWVRLMTPAVELAKAIADTDFVPKAMRGNAAVVAAAILYGDEVGLGPMQSLAKISVIEGKPSLAAEAQRALILAAGHDVWVEDASTSRVTVAGRRKGSDNVTRFTWTLDDAKRAQLVGRQNWRNYPRQMLLARASAELARALFADVIGGLAAVEEIEDLDASPTSDPFVPVAPSQLERAPDPTRRRSRRVTSPAVAKDPAPDPADPAPETPQDAAQDASQALPPLPGEHLDGDDADGWPAAIPKGDPPPDADRGGEGTYTRRDGEDVGPEPPMTVEDLDATPAETIRDPQKRKMHALFRERGVTDRQERLAIASTVVGRKVETSADLTVGEASQLIDALQASLEPVEP